VEFQGFINLTPFTAQPLLMADEGGSDLLVSVVKAGYRIEGTSTLVREEEQVPLRPAGVYNGDPARSSLKYAPEADFFKAATDVALIGHAHAPGGRPVAQLDVSLRVGAVGKTVRVFGDRHWVRPGRSDQIIGPRPFTTMPLTYERAFGGADLTPTDPRRHEREARNPVGTGLAARDSRRTDPLALPNLEDPKFLILGPGDRPPPAGFGFVGPDWQWRARYAGTYDDRWQKARMPLLPEDFDRRFFNAAHPDLIAPGYLRGGETVSVFNASPRGALTFALPSGQPELVLMMKDGTRHALAMTLDTVTIDTDGHRVELVWRASQPIFKRLHQILWIKTQLGAASAAANPVPNGWGAHRAA
jgi:hypothetical protein